MLATVAIEKIAENIEPAFVLLPEAALGELREAYCGCCPLTGEPFSLPRTSLAESVALKLAQRLNLSEGKMIGVLIARDSEGRLGFLKAFSGKLNGQEELAGWAEPLYIASIPCQALRQLEDWKKRLEELKLKLDLHPFIKSTSYWQKEKEKLRLKHKKAKARRASERNQPLGRLEEELIRESQAHSKERSELNRRAKQELFELRESYSKLEEVFLALKQTRSRFSKSLQYEIQAQFAGSITGLIGVSLEKLYPKGMPTGSGDCCAPKLLAKAAKEGYRPLALAEMWWGPTSIGGRQAGKFYPACRERCQPLLGPLLRAALSLPIKAIYTDNSLVAVSKPDGLLSVPGRYPWNQDSLLSRLYARWGKLYPVHRLDFETSGLLLFARDEFSQKALRGQFARREVVKVYQALLESTPPIGCGVLDQPLGACPQALAEAEELKSKRPLYRVMARGKPARTEFKLLDAKDNRVELRPLTGRSHQLRVHMAQGLGCPILGDSLYGQGEGRLMLHAHRLSFKHPRSGKLVELEAELPF